jgi:hypothetical protein
MCSWHLMSITTAMIRMGLTAQGMKQAIKTNRELFADLVIAIATELQVLAG